MHGDARVHVAQHLEQGHVESGFPLRMPGKTRSLSAWRNWTARRNTPSADADNGTTCGLPAFIRAAGIVQVTAFNVEKRDNTEVKDFSHFLEKNGIA